MKEPLTESWSKTSQEVLQGVGSNPETGLSPSEASERLKKFGPNRLVKEHTVTFWDVFWEEVREPMILLLLVVGVFYSFWGELRDAITIFTVIILLVLTEVFTEYRADKSMAILRRLYPATTPVLRGGAHLQIPATEVVRGDITPLEMGDRVPADGRVVSSFGFQVDESPLTGESAPVSKEDTALSKDTPLADRTNMVFAGTTVTAGRGVAVVTATGMDTELGRITGLVAETEEPETPLEQAMGQLAGLLVWVAVFFSLVIPLIGFFQGNDYKEMILIGLSLSFAVIPEELPIIIEMVLGVGAFALSRKHVLIRRLKAAETLGGVTVIVTDKTGTITENRMTVARLSTEGSLSVFPSKGLSLADVRLLKVGVLTSHIKKTQDSRYTGDPLEVALLEAAKADGISPEEIQSQNKLKQEFSFDNQRKMMSVVFQEGDGLVVYAKGAPEVILSRCYRIQERTGEREKTRNDEAEILKRAEDMGSEAMRVIAFACKKVGNVPKLAQEEAEDGLVFLGLAGLADPPRAGVAEAVEATRQAGIRTIMVSGDLPLTVKKVASQVGIDSGEKLITGAEMSQMAATALKEKLRVTSIFARINPEQKLQIVRALQDSGEVVAVTGDGINDAPALKSADIGVAMGERGTEAAREAADMVLTDDSYNSIVDGVREGRKIFDNLTKGVTYYLAVKVALVLSFLVPLILGIPFPFAPVQIVLLELFMDLAASATYTAEPMEKGAMQRPPRPPKEKFVNRRMLAGIFLGAISLAAAVLFNYLLYVYAYGVEGLLQARSVAFGTWLVGHIYLAFTMRSHRETLFRIGLFSNRVMLIWAAAAVLFLIAITSIPFAQEAMKVTSLSLLDWAMVVSVPFVTIYWQEIQKTLAHL